MNKLDKFQPNDEFHLNRIFQQKRTGNLRFRKGVLGSDSHISGGLEEEWVVSEIIGDREWREWRPIPVVEHDE